MSYANLLASAGVVGAQYRTARDAGVTLSNLHFAPADVVAAAHGVNNAASLSDAAGSGIAAAKASLAFLEAVVTKVPALGTALSLASLGINIQKLHDEWAAGDISAQTAAAVLGDLSAIGGVIAVAAISGPAGLALGIALSAISAGLTIATISLAVAEDQVWVDAVAANEAQLGVVDEYINQQLTPYDYVSIQGMPSELNACFISARAVVLQRDPLVLDLDGDGLELSAASGNVLFDHNADGIKTGTGWARPDDGFLVRDLNGNGSIDSGRELFGVDTVKSNGQLATQGFDALADLDSNGDGQITSADAAWAQLQVWRDTNQDGISQSGELSGLDALGITRIGLNGSSSGPQAGQTINNNRVALSTTFTRNGINRTVGAIDLEANGFFLMDSSRRVG